MKKFQFKLEIVLKERKRVEDLRLREWTKAERFVKQLEAERDAMVTRLNLAFDEATQLATLPQNSSAQFMGMDSFIKGEKIRIDWKEQHLEKARKFSERRRVEYVAASQKRKALEKLKERKIAEHSLKVKKHEARIQDDLYTMRWRLSTDGEEEFGS